MKRIFSGRVCLIFLLIAMMITGCAVNQDKEVAIYRTVLDGEPNHAPPSFDPESPLTLQQALALANANNEKLALAGEDYLQTLIQKDRAFSRFLPTLAFVPVFMRQEKSVYAEQNPMLENLLPEYTQDAPLEASLSLHPFRDIPVFMGAGGMAKAKKARLLDQQAILLLDVAQVYYQVMCAERLVNVLEDTVAVETERLREMEAKQDAGMARAVDVAQTAARLAGTKSELIGALNDVANGRAALALLIGAPEVDGPLSGGFSAPENPQWSVEVLKAEAKTHRQDLIAAEEDVRSAARGLEAAWGEYFPSVGLNLDKYLSRESFPDDVDWTSLIQVRVPIFSAGMVHADVREAYSRLRQAHLAESWTFRQVAKDIQVAQDDFIRSGEKLASLQVQVEAARRALDHAENSYKVGLVTNLTRLIAQDDLLSAQLKETREIFNRTVNYLRLLRATGSLSPSLSAVLPASGLKSSSVPGVEMISEPPLEQSQQKG